jgi:hypothetical protein
VVNCAIIIIVRGKERNTLNKKGIKTMIKNDKILVLKEKEAGTIAIIDNLETAAAYLVEELWIGPRSKIWSCKQQAYIEVQNVFGATGRQGISEEELYSFCVNMFKEVYSEVYEWNFDIDYVDYWTLN